MRARIIGRVIPIAVVTMVQVMVPPTAMGNDSDSVFSSEGSGNSVGVTHTRTEVVDPVPEAGGGSYEDGSGGGEGVVEQEREDPCAGVPEAKRGSCAAVQRGLARPGGSAGPRGGVSGFSRTVGTRCSGGGIGWDYVESEVLG